MDKNATAQTIRRLALQYQGLVEAADHLEMIGSLENHEAEVRARLEALQVDEAKARYTLAIREQAARDADAEQEATRKQTREEAQAGSAAAAEHAKAIVEAGRKRAEDLLEGAAALNEEQSRALTQRQIEAELVLAQIAQEEKDALERKAAAESAADEAQGKLDSIRESIAKIAQA